MLFVLNDRPDLVEACGADGVHVGQDDMPPAEARAIVGPDRIVGRSTHAPDQADAAQADPDVDYLAIGPVWETPTKLGRPAAGLDYVEYAARTVTKPWFAIGGIDAANLSAVVDRGASGIVVVRAIGEADDPEAAARASSRRASLRRQENDESRMRPRLCPLTRARRRDARLARAVETRRAAGGGHRRPTARGRRGRPAAGGAGPSSTTAPTSGAC